MSKARGAVHRWAALFGAAASRWIEDECYRLGASLSFYAVFSLFPLILLCVTILGFFLGHDPTVREKLLDDLARSGAPQLRPVLDEALAGMQRHETARGVGAVAGIVTLLVGASAVFSELSASLDTIWRVRTPRSDSMVRSALRAMKSKALSFLVVLGAMAALLASVLLSTLLSALAPAAARDELTLILWIAFEAAASLVLLTLFFAAMFKTIPRANVRWKDVAYGALLTAFLFTALKRLLAWYLAHVASYAAYGAIGGFLGLLMWIYLASLILFFGAEFTCVYAGRPPPPRGGG